MSIENKRFVFDIKFTGYTTVQVDAENIEDAREKASEYFTQKCMSNPIQDLSYKSTELTILGDE